MQPETRGDRAERGFLLSIQESCANVVWEVSCHKIFARAERRALTSRNLRSPIKSCRWINRLPNINSWLLCTHKGQTFWTQFGNLTTDFDSVARCQSDEDNSETLMNDISGHKVLTGNRHSFSCFWRPPAVTQALEKKFSRHVTKSTSLLVFVYRARVEPSCFYWISSRIVRSLNSRVAHKFLRNMSNRRGEETCQVIRTREPTSSDQCLFLLSPTP